MSRMPWWEKIQQLHAELAEARAWLADTEAEYAKRVHELDEARAQIAAKDAALTHIVNECSTFPIKDGLAFRVESIALNALATPQEADA